MSQLSKYQLVWQLVQSPSTSTDTPTDLIGPSCWSCSNNCVTDVLALWLCHWENRKSMSLSFSVWKQHDPRVCLSQRCEIPPLHVRSWNSKLWSDLFSGLLIAATPWCWFIGGTEPFQVQTPAAKSEKVTLHLLVEKKTRKIFYIP